MISTELPRISNSRLKPNTTSPRPPTLATGAHSDASITTYIAFSEISTTRGANLHARGPAGYKIDSGSMRPTPRRTLSFDLGLERDFAYVVSRMSVLLGPVRDWLNAGLGFFYPETCQLCGRGRATAAEGFVCGHCREQARFIQPPFCERCGLPWEGEITTAFECTNCREMKFHFRSARAAVKAEGVVRDAIHRYKYKRAFWF